MRIKLSVSKTVLIMILAVFTAVFALTGCSDDDDKNSIRICNQDDEEYVVKLYHDDNTFVQELRLGEFYDVGNICDKFENVEDGRKYYITIHEEDGSATASDESDIFFMDTNTKIEFRIKSPGMLINSDDGIIQVCNRDDERYRVILYNDDDDVVEDFWLDEFYDTRDRCDSFEPDNGSYYIIIHEEGAETQSDSSDVFVYDGVGDRLFHIESPGVIERD